MKILITGAAGFIGFHLIKRINRNKKFLVLGVDNLNDYYSVDYKKLKLKYLKVSEKFKFIKLDLKNKKKLNETIKKFRPDCIFHLASQPGIMYSYKNPKTYISNNIIATQNLIEASIKNKVSKFYFTSSSSVYGNKKKFPIKENAKLKPLNLYAVTKKKCEKILINKCKNSKIDLKIFRPFTVYGTYARPDMIFITYLNKIINKKVFNLFNNGQYLRDFTYVNDLANILYKFISVGKLKDNVFNICSSKPIKVNKIINIINKISKKKCKIKLQPYRKGEMIKTFGDNSKIKKYINFKKYTNINYGIKKTVEWYFNFKNKKILNFKKIQN